MLIRITYDIGTTSKEGKRRLIQISKKCMGHGQRVQKFVFDCIPDSTQFRRLKHELEELIKQTACDFINLGINTKQKLSKLA
ncbi:CRISPR-associated endonuclease Cas2 [Paenibacillus eucommiae]|uniref:CRISPR-associated protein Cas2 n=1 Tax=Paenibacillus eucommiae TaxID=1355755 RepID=A0ABS4IMK7_9BACL|nr:CRISPR-associated protein Cas2 [Paenibacillus eucommiae]